jgi:hypothetical protein
MERRSFLKAAGMAATVAPAWSMGNAESRQSAAPDSSANPTAPGQASPETILLKDYRPRSLYKIPVTEVPKAKFPIIDMHSHSYAKTPDEIAAWVRNMDEVGVEKTIILSGATGTEFDEVYRKYAVHPDRFELWCGFDYSGYDQLGFGQKAIAALEKCHQAGARGVGELHDKGKGLSSDEMTALGMHPDDPRMDSLFERCGQLGMPVNIHVADPIWMYEAMDNRNDVKKHSGTTFIACHFANLDYDLGRLGQLLDKHSNLFADISARYAETAPIPRFTSQFYAKYEDRLLYGTDMGFDKSMYRVTFRILETLDEHFYEIDMFDYHWSLNGFGLPDEILQKIYRTSANKILASRELQPRA